MRDHNNLTKYLSEERRKLTVRSFNNFIASYPVPSVGLSTENSEGNEMWSLLPNSSIHLDIFLGLCIYQIVNGKNYQLWASLRGTLPPSRLLCSTDLCRLHSLAREAHFWNWEGIAWPRGKSENLKQMSVDGVGTVVTLAALVWWRNGSRKWAGGKWPEGRDGLRGSQRGLRAPLHGLTEIGVGFWKESGACPLNTLSL